MFCVRYAPLALILFAFVLPARASWISPFISEFHYDNPGVDVDEFVAVTGPAGLDLSGWQIILYNGANGDPYRSVSLSGVLGGRVDAWAEAYWRIAGMQNGPDALALVAPADRLIDFVAYEGDVLAASGVAAGLGAKTLPVAEGGATDVGSSLQRVGGVDSWAWVVAPATPGELNRGLGGFDAAGVPAVSAWILWLSGIGGWLLLSIRHRPWQVGAVQGLQALRCHR